MKLEHRVAAVAAWCPHTLRRETAQRTIDVAIYHLIRLMYPSHARGRIPFPHISSQSINLFNMFFLHIRG